MTSTVAALAGLLALSVAAAPLQAAERLDAAAIEDLLSGNTVAGTWDGEAYRQYFAPDGTTLYQPKGGRRTEGKWRVNPEQDWFESFWSARRGWTPYRVLDTAEGYAFEELDGTRQCFEVLKGKQLPPPE